MLVYSNQCNYYKNTIIIQFMLKPNMVSLLYIFFKSFTFASTYPGVDFINVLRTAFTLIGPKSVIFQSSSQFIFMLLGSTGAKAARRTLMKLTPGRTPSRVYWTRIGFFKLVSSHELQAKKS